jgi:DNA-binding NarL/FixJ family response regulator
MPNLTPREQEVYYLLLSPLSRHEIATVLGVSYLTAREHMVRIYRKLNVQSRQELCACPLAEIPACLETKRQRQVMHGVMCGLSNKLIARSLGISPRTVKGHITLIYQRLGVSDRLEALALCRGEKDANP